MTARRILIIGYGAIGRTLAQDLAREPERRAVLGVLLRPGSRSLDDLPGEIHRLTDVAKIQAFAPDLVVEAAGHCAVREVVPHCLTLGLPVLLSSIGALHDDDLRQRLTTLASSHGGRILLPSGALGALDYVRAVRRASDLVLAYESVKPPAAWTAELQASGRNPADLTEPLSLFVGTARQAAASYPQNLNVAAALALAGAGFDATQVTVTCDPRAAGNTHRVRARSVFGTMEIAIANTPSPDNPKTSWIVAQALLAAIDQHFSPIQYL